MTRTNRTLLALVVIGFCGLVACTALYYRYKSDKIRVTRLAARIEEGASGLARYHAAAPGGGLSVRKLAKQDLALVADWVRRSRIDPSPVPQEPAGGILVLGADGGGVGFLVCGTDDRGRYDAGKTGDERAPLHLIGPAPCVELFARFGKGGEGEREKEMR